MKGATALPLEISDDRVLREFLELVRIDSPSFEEAAIARVLEAKLRALGFTVENDQAGPSTGNLIARLGAASERGSTIALNAHMDTVEPGRGVTPAVCDGAVWSSGDTVLGADCKASLAAILEGVRAAMAAGRAIVPGLEVVLTYAEERAHPGARALDLANLRAGVCFTLDAEAPVGTIITSAPAYHSLRAIFKGRAAHAGISPESGVNALVAASRAIARLDLGRIDEETTANIGLIRGGTGRNTVPALVELEGEVRSRNDAKLAAQVQAITGAMREEAERIGAVVEIQVNKEYSAFTLAPDSAPIRYTARALERAGAVVKLDVTGGGSDANDLNVKGLPTAVLGTGMVGAHSVQEHIAVADLVLLSRVVAELVTEGSQ